GWAHAFFRLALFVRELGRGGGFVGLTGHGALGLGRPRWAPSRARTINGACKSTSILTPLGSSTARSSQIAFPSCAGAREEASRRAILTARRRTCGSRRAIVDKNCRDSRSASGNSSTRLVEPYQVGPSSSSFDAP